MNHPRTDFARYTHRQLHAMVFAGDPRTLRAAADTWDAIAARLHEQAGSLEKRLVDFKHKWQGGAANQYMAMITDLYGGLRRLGDIAFTMRNLAHDSADALTKAQATMPQPHNVPELAPGVVQMATTPLQVDPATPAEMIYRMQRQQADATAAVRAHQQASQASSAAHAQAIIVITELAERYDAANSAMPADSRRLTAQGQRNPLFGNMFTAGLATATAAAAGRFSGVLPRVPAWAQPNKEVPTGTPEPLPPIDPIEPADLGGGGLGDLGGAGGGIGGGGGGFGGGAPAPLPTAHSGMVAGAAGAAGIAAGALGAAAAGTAASAGAGMMPMMPMMPMHPGGGMDSANARRVPPWLVETEDVWGESSAITPSVIGEDQAEQS